MLCIPLLVIVTSFIGANADGELCEPNMKYHRHTHTCIVLVKERKYYENAENHCKTVFTGGHLVQILDKETDEFLKDKLLEDNDWAYIGLRDTVNGQYKWDGKEDAKYFGWFTLPHKPNPMSSYTVITKRGWIEYHNIRLKFICQKPSTSRSVFFLNTSVLINTTLQADLNTENLFSCKIISDQYFELKLFHEVDGTTKLLASSRGRELNHRMLTTCISSGQYVCKITNQTNTDVIEMKGVLKVRCKAFYCPEEDEFPKYSVTSFNEDFKKKICVQVYPKPTSFVLFKDNKNNTVSPFKPVNKYNIDFTYINNISTRGQLEIHIFRLAHSEFGKYAISVWYNEKIVSRLYFNITGPPQCPENLTTEALGHDTVRLTWSPKYDGISEQTFEIFREGTPSDVKVKTLLCPQEDVITSNVTGLSPDSSFNFYINVFNEHGYTTCKHLTVTVLTQDAPYSGNKEETSKENNTAEYIIPLALLIVLITIGIFIIVFVLVRRRRKSLQQSDQKKMNEKLISDVNEVSTLQNNDSDVNSREKIRCPEIVDVSSAEVAENIYNNVLENKVNTITRMPKPPRKSRSSSVKFKDIVSMETGETQDLNASSPKTSPDDKMACTSNDITDIYANTPNTSLHNFKEQKKEVEKPKDAEKDDDARTTMTEDDGLTTQTDEDGQSTKKNDDGRTTKKKDDGRTISPQGLVYVTVEIIPAGKNSKLIIETEKCNETKPSSEKCNETKPSSEKFNETKPSSENVEYCSLDYLATSLAAAHESEDGVMDDEQNE